MSTEQMIAKMRKIELLQSPELLEVVQLTEQKDNPDGTKTNYYQIADGKLPPGYLWITFDAETEEIKASEMNVNFDHLVGLNRSPIQLRLTAQHVLKYVK